MSNATANAHDETGKRVVMVHDGSDISALHSELKGDLPLSNNGMFTTSNPELVAELEQKYEGHVTSAPWRTTTKPQGRVMFTMPEMPWKKKKE